MVRAIAAIAAAALVFGWSAQAVRAEDSCESLVSYRDGALVKEWDVAAARYRYNSELRADVASLRQEVLDDSSWARSETGALIGTLALHLKTTADFVGDVLGFVPGTGHILSGTTNAAREFTAKIVKDGLTAGKTINAIGKEGVEITTTKFLLGQLNPVTKSVKTVWTLSENLRNLANFPGDVKKLRQEVNAAVDRLDASLQDFDAKIAGASEKIEYVNAMKNAIDEKCSKQQDAANPECLAKQKHLVSIGQSCQANAETCDANGAVAIHDWLRDNACPGIYSQDSSFQGGSAVGVGQQSQACIDINNRLMAAANAGDLETISSLTPQVSSACQ